MAPKRAKSGVSSKSGGDGGESSGAGTRSGEASKGEERGSMESIVAQFPLTLPFPDPLTDHDLIPASDVSLEQDLLLNIDNQRSWNTYLNHVVSTNQPSENQPLFHSPDDTLSSIEVRLLGPLASSANRMGLRRITFAYERAIAQFPNYFGIWRDYLLLRMQFVLAEPRGGLDGFWKRQIKTGKQNLDAGPTLLEGSGVTADGTTEEDEWAWGKRQGASIEALSGHVGHREWESLAAVFERALTCIPRAPRIWLLYFTVLLHPGCPPTLSHTHTRRTFDRALRTLAPSQHLRIWKLYLRWAEMRSGETCLRVWRRYLSVDPSLTERFVSLLERMRAELEEEEDEEEEEEEEKEEDEAKAALKAKRSLEAAKVLLRLASEAGQGRYTSPEGKSPYQLLIEWLELCEKYPDEVGMDREGEDALPSTSGESSEAGYKLTQSDVDVNSSSRLPVSHIVRSLGLARFPDQAGRLWTGLATYWIRRNDLETAKATFEEGIANVVTVRDFTQIFDAYAETSENVVGFLMEALGEEEDEEEEDDEEQTREAKEAELDQKMKDFEELMERRPFLVNDVLLRRNPSDVQEWEKRILLYGDDDEKVVETYKKAIETINPRKATANHHILLINFARFYEEGGNAGREYLHRLQSDEDNVDEDDEVPEADLESARKVFEKATTIPFKRVDDLADVWCQWASMEARQGNFDAALRVMVRATAAPRSAAQVKSISFYDESLPVQTRLFKSAKLWAFYVDLQEALDTDESVEGTKAVYDRMIELKIATPQVLINYAGFLEGHHYFEEAFKVYERGVEAFTYPVAFELWNVYLSKFVARYGGSKIERARDLFEQALESCPEKFVRPLFLKYGQLEEEHGLSKRAMRIYERATERVAEDDRFDMFAFYIAKVAEGAGGIAATRSVYSRAIEVLPDRQTARMCLRFAALERKLGEVDRARAIYGHAAQFVDPRSDDDEGGGGVEAGLGFWKAWNRFEIECGTEDTFREMLRIKRSVQAQFNTDVSYIAAYARSAAAKAKQQQTNGTAAEDDEGGKGDEEENDPMRRAEVEARARTGGPSFVAAKQSQAQVQETSAAENEEEIGGGDDDDEDLM